MDYLLRMALACFRKSVIICCLFIFFLPEKIVIAETVHIPTTDFISVFNEKASDPQSAMFMAKGFGPYYSGYSWRYGIVGNDKKYYLHLILSGNTQDAEVLSCKMMIKRDELLDYQDYQSIWDEFKAILLQVTLKEQIFDRREEVFPYIYHGNGYCGRYITEQFVIQESPLINPFGEEAGKHIYYPNPATSEEDKKFQIEAVSFIQQYLPNIKERDLEQENDHMFYSLPYGNNLYIVLKKNGLLDALYLYTDKDEKEITFQQYLNAFIYLSDHAYTSELADLLLLQYGEEFAWSNYIKTDNPDFIPGCQTLFFDPETKWYIQLRNMDPPSIFIAGHSMLSEMDQ